MEQAHVVIPIEMYDQFKEMEARQKRNQPQQDDMLEKLKRAKEAIMLMSTPMSASENPSSRIARLNELGVRIIHSINGIKVEIDD